MTSNDFIGKVFGGYKIKRVLTRGGMESTIYEGEAIKSDENNYLDQKNKTAAIKIIERSSNVDDEIWHRIKDEVFTLSRMSAKKNVIKFYNSIIDEEKIVIIMEFVNGSPLENKISEYGHFSVEESIYLFREILIGVSQLHGNSFEIIHRDLKPANILLLKNQTEIRIIDFGIASVFDKTISKDRPEVVTNEKSFFGTVTYVTPDIAECKSVNLSELYKKVNRQFDFHSLGVIFHEMLTGQKPFEYEDESDPKCLMYFVQYDFAPMKWLNPKVPNSLENIIFKLTASKENHKVYRYKDVSEILKDLDESEIKFKSKVQEDILLNPIENRELQNKMPFNVKVQNNDLNRQKKKSWIVYTFLALSFILVIFLIIWSVVQ